MLEGETVIFSQAGALVTNQRVVIDGKSYAVSEIHSADATPEMGEWRIGRVLVNGATVLILLGIGLGAAALWNIFWDWIGIHVLQLGDEPLAYPGASYWHYLRLLGGSGLGLIVTGAAALGILDRLHVGRKTYSVRMRSASGSSSVVFRAGTLREAAALAAAIQCGITYNQGH